MISQFKTYIENQPAYQAAFIRCFLAATDRPCWWTWSRMEQRTRLIWQAERATRPTCGARLEKGGSDV